jgi:scyllo-inositol 2-dehydrogenase (NADP+)
MKQESIGVGLVGFGLAGARLHAPVIGAVPGFRIAAIQTSRAEEARAAWPEAAVVPDLDALLARAEVDLVVVASPNDTHASIARAALAAGRHVVIDKPFVTDPAMGEALIDQARAAGLVLSAYHNRRWDADFLSVADLLAQGTLGEVMLAELCWDRHRAAIKPGWREQAGEGAGLLADLGPHLADQALRLWGWPDTVSADIAVQREGAAVDDYFDLNLHYGTRRVRLASSTLVAAPRPRFALHGTRGSFVKYGIDPQEAMLRARTPDWSSYGVEPTSAHGVLTDLAGQGTPVPSHRGDWRLFYRGIADAIRTGTPPPVDPADALAGLRLLALARRSATEGRVLAAA